MACYGTSGSCWLELAEPLALLAKSSVQPWEHGGESCRLQPVRWERVPAPAVGSSSGASAPPSPWDHEVTWCARPGGGGSVAVHRFTPRDGACGMGAAALRQWVGVAERERASQAAALGGGSDDSASNVGGFHGERDLLERPEVRHTALPALIGAAVHGAALAEAEALGRAPIATTADEAWFNSGHVT